MTNDNFDPKRSPGLMRLAGPLLMVGILVIASLYASGVLHNLFGVSGMPAAPAGACAAAQGRLATLKPLVKGEIAALQVPESAKPVRALSFNGPAGEAKTLGDFRGKTILLNLWATWCVPCRKEMPALDALQKAVGGPDFEVVAVNIDTRNFEKPKAFLDEIGVKSLAYYADPTAKVFQDLKAAGRAFGMPTTLLIDAAGCELAYLAGPAEWSSPEAVALVKAALER